MKNVSFLISWVLITLLFLSCDKESVEPLSSATTELSAAVKKSNNYTAHLRPEEEVSVVPINSNATGQAIFKLSKDGTELYYKLIVANIESVRFGHLHLAPAGSNGGVVVDLVGRTENYPNGIIAEGIITSTSLKGALLGKTLADLIAAIEAGNIYTNVHSDKYPGGEIRGQVK